MELRKPSGRSLRGELRFVGWKSALWRLGWTLHTGWCENTKFFSAGSDLTLLACGGRESRATKRGPVSMFI